MEEGTCLCFCSQIPSDFIFRFCSSDDDEDKVTDKDKAKGKSEGEKGKKVKEKGKEKPEKEASGDLSARMGLSEDEATPWALRCLRWLGQPQLVLHHALTILQGSFSYPFVPSCTQITLFFFFHHSASAPDSVQDGPHPLFCSRVQYTSRAWRSILLHGPNIL